MSYYMWFAIRSWMSYCSCGLLLGLGCHTCVFLLLGLGCHTTCGLLLGLGCHTVAVVCYQVLDVIL